MPEYSFTITQHDPERHWIVLGQQRRTVELGDDADFFEWAQRAWPEPHYTVQLDPYQLGRTASLQ